MAERVHIIGAGLAGLAAAVRAGQAGHRVIVHEAAPQAGGRCRSYFEPALGLTIDNGNHLLLSGNQTALDYLGRIGAAHLLPVPPTADFAFIDLPTGARWTLRPSLGRFPGWVFNPRRRVPGTRVREYLAPLRLFRATPGQTVGDVMRCSGPLYEKLWRPLLLAGLNTEPTDGSAMLAAALIRGTLAAGGKACKPLIAGAGLSTTFIDPAVALLGRNGGELRLGRSLKAIGFSDGRVAALDFGSETVDIGPGDEVILAVPPHVAADLVPDITTPETSSAIINAHFRIDPPADMPAMMGVIGGLSEWMFRFDGRISVTISGGDRLLRTPRADLAEAIWAEVAAATGLTEELPAWQIVKERRATFAATPAEVARRPGTKTRFTNLFLAGDWIDTGLPATIEGAIASGYSAASALSPPEAAQGERRAAA